MTARTKKKYSEDFKEHAVRLANSLGLARASEQLGVAKMTIEYWKAKQAKGKKLAENERVESEKEELIRLRRENAEQKDVIQILKKAAAVFSKDHLK